MSNKQHLITRQLTEKFFDGTISPEETARLVNMAGSLQEHDLADDPGLLRDLRLVQALHSSEAFTANLCMPDGLEERLERHIDSLSCQKGFLFRKWPAIAGAAAAVAAIATIGFGVSRESSSMQYADADTSALLPELTLSVPDTRPAPEAVAESPKTGSTQSIRKTVAKVKSATPSKASSATKGNLSSRAASMEAAIPTSAIASIPEAIATVSDITPIVINATVDPLEVLAQPISTLSQTIDIVCESYETVLNAFNAAGSTIETANDRVSLAYSNLPLHEI